MSSVKYAAPDGTRRRTLKGVWSFETRKKHGSRLSPVSRVQNCVLKELQSLFGGFEELFKYACFIGPAQPPNFKK